MNIFTKNSVWKKLVIVLLIIILFQFVNAKPVHADVVEFGGKLMSPILSLLTSLGDGIMDIIGRTIMGAHSTLYEVELGSKFWETLGTIIVAIAAAAVAVALVLATAYLAGIALAAIEIAGGVTVGVGTLVAVGTGAGLMSAVWFNDQVLPDDLYLPMYTYSAEEIFEGNILLFDVNFFDANPPQIQEHKDGDGKVDYYYYINDKGEEVKTSNQSSSVMLRKTISSWYNALRNICIVLMLSILVYIGIRMMLTSVASDKAKYLTMLKDWFIGLCLLFLMHYIMAFSVTLVEKLTDVVKTSVDKNSYNVVMEAKNKKIKEAVDEKHLNMPDLIQKGSDGKEYLSWPTNLMGSLRLQLQMEQYGASYVGLSICFFILCIFTLYFTYVYLKRVLYMAFLTLISPMVALTYCIDKINDGQAQGFNKWFKEYIFNLLIQPMHLLLYYILVTSAFEFASSNVIYSIVALAFMIPAEKLLRSLFGFEKAHTPPMLGPAGAMAAGQMLSRFLGSGKKGKIGAGNGSGASDSAEDQKLPNVKDIDPYKVLGGGEDGNTPGTDVPETPEALPEVREAPDPVLEQYRQEGVNQNPEGLYFNPWTDEYDPETQQQNQEPEQTPQLDQTAPEQTPRLDQDDIDQNAIRTGDSAHDDDRKESKVKRRIKRAMTANWAAQKAVFRQAPKQFKGKIKSTIENAHPMRTAGRMAAGAAAATAAGAVGVAIGASTGDFGNVVKVGGGAIGAAYAKGSNAAANIPSPMDDKEIQKIHDDAYNKGPNGEYKEDAMNEHIEKYVTNEKVRADLERAVGKQEARKMLRRDKEGNGEVAEYIKHGATETKEWIALHKLQEEGVARSNEEALAYRETSNIIGKDIGKLTDKDEREWMKTFKNKMERAGSRNPDVDAKRALDGAIRYQKHLK